MFLSNRIARHRSSKKMGRDESVAADDLEPGLGVRPAGSREIAEITLIFYTPSLLLLPSYIDKEAL